MIIPFFLTLKTLFFRKTILAIERAEVADYCQKFPSPFLINLFIVMQLFLNLFSYRETFFLILLFFTTRLLNNRMKSKIGDFLKITDILILHSKIDNVQLSSQK